ncbi:uncharacterized protein LOC133739356 isoform X2 [Rosa rugosa]|uniref:uncharacterized protein LOC133739356 isoform X2 n=1 Tax=Rosa rugosa TaxID=74645 RepID=UPI002B411C33|nr:uncharacterized protein LOC133739356 isoform X2 [Rosa rugosa]
MDHQADAYRSCCISSLSTLSHEETSLILLSHIVLGCKFVCSAVNKAGLAKLFGLAGETNVQVGTPICIPQRDFIDIGRIASIENNHKPVDLARKGLKVAIKIVGTNSDEQQKMYGRHFEMEDELVSHISRRSIDVLKTSYRDELSIDEWKLVVKLKKLFEIP